MFLIDSSAWIEYLRPNGSKKVKERVREILEKDNAVSCGIVIVEILRGAKDEKTFNLLKETLSSLSQIPIDETVIQRTSEWGFKLDRKGKNVSTTDLLIAAAAQEKAAAVLHLDSDFETIASVCGVKQERIAAG
ncbi:MAG: PIN domain-containing protein [Nitrospirae bacterium]|nr:PIN domain-containing protein [Nitrospirota bacterium]MCL5976896.1 PIN domain-containing protein [Nitrospirota bacterium]